jgi:putative ABC transport system permease protein
VLWRASLRYLRVHPAQLVLAVLGVAIGVAVVVGIDTASASARTAFERAAGELSGGATHAIRGGPSGVDERVFVELALDPLAPPSAPVIDRTVPHYGHPRRPLRVVGVDPFVETSFRQSFFGALGAAAGGLVREHGAGAAARTLAREYGVDVGEEIVLVVGGRNVGVRIAALFDASSALPNLLVVDLATAQELVGEPGRLDRIDLALPDEPAARERALERIRAHLPADCEVEAASARAASIADATAAFDLSLRALGFVALLVGVFLVYNTMTFSVVQRRPLWGTLRAIGATRGELFRLVCGEALAIGAVGTALGIALGLWLSRGLSQLVARTINDLYYRV